MQLSVPFVLESGSFSSVKETVDSAYSSIFDYKFHLMKTVEMNPFEGIMAVSFMVSVIAHAKIFIDTFRAKEVGLMNSLVLVEQHWDKARTQMVGAVNLIGAVSRLVDWGGDRSWFVSTPMATIVFKVLGSVAGVVHHVDCCIQSLEKMKEVERLGEIAKTCRVCQQEIFDASWYGHFSSFSANCIFMVYSGVQFVNAVLGVLVTSEITSMLLLSGIVMFSVSYFFYSCDNSAFELDHLRLLASRSGDSGLSVYSFVAR